MSDYKYFMIPLDSVPTNPTYPVWFSTWSNGQLYVEWSTERPPGVGGALPTWVIGRIEDNAPPREATIVWSGAKCIPPPPMELTTSASLTEFQTKFAQVLTARGA